MSLKRCMREVDSAEFAEWMAYCVWEPFGPEREDQRAGMVAALIANVNRDPKQRPTPYDVEDFFPRYGEPEIEETEPKPLESKLTAWAAAMATNKPVGPPGKSELREKQQR